MRRILFLLMLLHFSNYAQQFKLTDTVFKSGYCYKSTYIDYHFSGKGGDENSIDETPYINESSLPYLDSIVGFLKANKKINFKLYSISESEITFDSCVPCAFERAVKSYLVSKGVEHERLISSDQNEKLENLPDIIRECYQKKFSCRFFLFEIY